MLLLFYASLLLSLSHQACTEVTTPVGTFVGTNIASAQGEVVRAFLGIPYAQPPVGNLRFAKPQKPPNLESTFLALTYPPTCIQQQGVDLGPSSEDCLYLNVYTPMPDEQNNSSSPLKKVFVYIHGGGFFLGTANGHVPGDLVVQGDIIVVTVNYRLGWLGFAKGSTSEAPGNMGLWDQIMALQWVKDNIRSFGGDPDDITIGGQSAGSGSVSILTITPHAKDLFTKAVLLSMALFNSTQTLGSSDDLLEELAGKVGCTSVLNLLLPIDESQVLECLRQKPAEDFSLPFDPTNAQKFAAVDGDLLPRPIPELIYDQEYMASIGFYSRDYITSVTSNEGVIFFRGPLTIGPEFLAMTSLFLFIATGIPVTAGQRIVNYYNRPGNYEYKPVYTMYGDLIFAMPIMTFAEIATSVNNDTFSGQIGNTYVMLTNYTPSFMPQGYDGFYHAIDLCYIFDLSPTEALSLYYYLSPTHGFTPDDWEVKRQRIDTLAQFMKTGNPGTSLTGGAQWPAFDRSTEYFLELTPEPVIRQFPYEARRYFWNNEALA